MLELLFKVLDTLIEVFQTSREKRTELIDKILEPTMNSFESLHKSNVQTLLSYIELLEKSDEPFTKKHPLFQMLLKDSLEYGNLRQRVFSFADYVNNKTFTAFARAILAYSEPFSGLRNGLPHRLFATNLMRGSIYGEAKYLIDFDEDSEEQKRNKLIYEIQGQIGELNSAYRDVVDKYHYLKFNLLSITIQ